MNRIKISAGTKWEETVGYSRAVRSGSIITIAGTASVEDGKVKGVGDFYLQTKTILQKIEMALNETGAKLEDVVRTRIFVTDISRWAEVGRAHGEFFKDIKPATSMIEVRAFIDPKMLVEIEADAIVEEN